MLSLSDSAQVHRWATHLHRLQRNPWIGYGAALGAILIATLIRWAMSGLVHDRIPFTTYYPAIVVATLLGGFWLGILASILSAIVAWWMFMTPTLGLALDAAQLTSLITFIFVCFLLVGTVTALNSAISDKKGAQARQELLLKEMDHRVKNAFTLVNGIVGLSARYAKPQNLARDIQARLAALARAHDLTRPGLLSTESEEAQSMPFRALIDAIFAPYLDGNLSGNSHRLIVAGPDVLIQQQAVTSLALVLYELATNAVKCGSLSLPTGSVLIKLSMVDDTFELEWRERGSPKLTEAPTHEGFGTNLVRRVVADQVRGEVVYDWNPDGLILRLIAPSHHLIEVARVKTSA